MARKNPPFHQPEWAGSATAQGITLGTPKPKKQPVRLQEAYRAYLLGYGLYWFLTSELTLGS